MLKSDLQRIQHLARKNAEKARKEIAEEERKERLNPKQKEKQKVDETLDSSDAQKMFNDMKRED